MAKILVVDDEADLEALIKQKFRQKIREHQYEFVFAINGVKALEQLEQHHDVDVVCTVAFIDICSFTTISENETPDVVVKLLNKYFDLMVKEIIAQGGFIDKFIGDAIMAVFRGDYHLDRAIDACLAVRKRIEGLPNESGDIFFSPKVSIGINSGEMISGNIGSGPPPRRGYTRISALVSNAAPFKFSTHNRQTTR